MMKFLITEILQSHIVSFFLGLIFSAFKDAEPARYCRDECYSYSIFSAQISVTLFRASERWKGEAEQMYCRVSQWLRPGFRLVIGVINNLQVITTINYYIIAALHNVKSLHANLFSVSVLVFTGLNTGTIIVSLNHTLQILHINNIFRSHIKSSQVDF
jgi:hypothetical protein